MIQVTPGKMADDHHANLPPTTILKMIEPHYQLFEPHALNQVAHHDRHYVALLRSSQQEETTALKNQSIKVAQALQAGKDKRDIRKLKNRLSAIRSRARKESETKLAETRLLSLEAQVQLYSRLVSKLQRSDTHTRDQLLRRQAPPDRRLPRVHNSSRHQPCPGTLSPVSSSSTTSMASSPRPSSFSLSSEQPATLEALSNVAPNTHAYHNIHCGNTECHSTTSNQTSFIDPEHSSKVVSLSSSFF